jgi:hypothetical protein
MCTCHYGTAPLQVADKGTAWRVAANILDKQLQTADKIGRPDWVLGEVLITTSESINLHVTKNLTKPQT